MEAIDVDGLLGQLAGREDLALGVALAVSEARDKDLGRRFALIAAIDGSGTDLTRADPAAIREGLDALLVSADPRPGLRLLLGTRVGCDFLPEIAALDMPQKNKLRALHKDNLDHSIRVCAQAPRRLRVRWAALLHDIGKPPTRQIRGTKVTFKNHELVGGRLARKLLLRLGYSKEFAGDVQRLVEVSGRAADYSSLLWTDSAVRRFVVETAHVYDDALDLVRADCTSRFPDRRRAAHRRVADLRSRTEEIRVVDEEKARKPVLDGAEIMDLLGLAPGPDVGRARAFVKALSAEGQAVSRGEAERQLRSWWASQPA